jgi:hypothetical protein
LFNVIFRPALLVEEAQAQNVRVIRTQLQPQLPMPSVPTVNTAPAPRDEEQNAGGLFAGYKRRRTNTSSVPAPVSVSLQVDRYFEEVDGECENDCLQFWAAHKERYPALYQLAISLLSVPASSAPVERVFSHGGIMMRPHRAALADTTLSHCEIQVGHD